MGTHEIHVSAYTNPNVCSHTGLRIPECHCPRCHEALLARYANGSDGVRKEVGGPNWRSRSPLPEAPHRLLDGVDIAPGAEIAPFTNLYGCRIGAESRIGPFVEIQRGASVGARCNIQRRAAGRQPALWHVG